MLFKGYKFSCLRVVMLMVLHSIAFGAFAMQDEEGMTFEAQPSKKSAIFDNGEGVVYNVDIKSHYKSAQSGTISYLITSNDNKEVAKSSKEINIGARGEEKVTLRMPGQRSGVYKLNIMINVTEYDDTIRRVFVVDPSKIRSADTRPADFDEFWATTRDSLDKVPMDLKITEQKNLEKDGLVCYLVEMKSLGKITVRGWLTLPKKRNPDEKLAVWLCLPGYGGTGIKPIYGNADLAVFAFNPRGQGNSKDVINPSPKGYLTTSIENKYRYIMRGAIMDCVRALEFLCARKDIDSKSIVVSGGSMGGYLALALASLDDRVKICSANNPVFSDFRSSEGSEEWPMKDVDIYCKARGFKVKNILNNLDYYDLKNFVGSIKCKTLIGISLLDNLAPPYNSYAMLNNMKNKNILRVYPNLAHEVPPSMFEYLSNWMMDEFGLF